MKIFRADPLAWVFFLAITAFICFAAGTVFAAPAGVDKLQKQVLVHTAQLNNNCSASLVYSGRDQVTGLVKTILLTAKHCVAGQKSDMKVEFQVYQNNRIVKRDQYIARVAGEWYKGDLALLELRDKQTYFANVAKIAPDKTELFMAEDVWTVGYPLAMSLTITRGLFGGLETQDFNGPGMEYYRATPDIAGGNSGGALYHQNAAGDYEIIGVTTAGVRGNPFVGLYTTVIDIREYLKIALPEALGAEK